jgi:GMC oxidoreductase
MHACGPRCIQITGGVAQQRVSVLGAMVSPEGKSATRGETEPAKNDCQRADRTALHHTAAGGGAAARVITAAPTPAPASQQSSKVIHAMTTNLDETIVPEADFAERVRHNQPSLGANLSAQYDFIVCGSGSSGSVVARRLAENADVNVLLLEAGGPDDVPAVMRAEQWPANLGSERDWHFAAQPNPYINGRSIPYSMGKVLGGGSSINVMAWARGHKNDWDFFAAEAGDKAWSYELVLDIYRRIEDWHGAPDPDYRGTGGPVYVEPARDPSPIAPAMIEGARSVGIPTFESQNGRMMEGDGGASILEMRARGGCRQSVFRSYVFPYMNRANLTVLTGALVTRVTFEGNRATGVEFSHDGQIHRVGAGSEVVLSLGAIHTPKVLMHRASVSRPTCSDTASRWCSICRGSVRTCRITPLLAVYGNISGRCRRATPGVRRPIFGRATQVWTLQTCRPPKAKLHGRRRRPRPDSTCLSLAGPCSAGWCGRKAAAISV